MPALRVCEAGCYMNAGQICSKWSVTSEPQQTRRVYAAHYAVIHGDR
jgi:hypothetical protein